MKHALVLLAACIALASTGCYRCLSYSTQYVYTPNGVVAKQVCAERECRGNYVKGKNDNCISPERAERQRRRSAE